MKVIHLISLLDIIIAIYFNLPNLNHKTILDFYFNVLTMYAFL